MCNSVVGSIASHWLLVVVAPLHVVLIVSALAHHGLLSHHLMLHLHLQLLLLHLFLQLLELSVRLPVAPAHEAIEQGEPHADNPESQGPLRATHGTLGVLAWRGVVHALEVSKATVRTGIDASLFFG